MHEHVHGSCRKAAINVRRGKQSGFILTLELLIILTVMGTVIYFALDILQRWLIESIDPMGGNHVVVFDGAAPPVQITRTASFNSQEAPELIYRPTFAEAALLGIRGSEFTSRQRIYYTGDGGDCTGMTRWLLDPTEDAMAASIAASRQFLDPALKSDVSPISDLYMLQTIAYAMGPDPLGGPPTYSTLAYRAKGSLSTSPATPPGTGGLTVTSEWASDRYGNAKCHNLLGGVPSQLFAGDTSNWTGYAAALEPYLVQSDFSYEIGVPISGGGGITAFTPQFWVPSQIASTAPVPTPGINNVTTQTPGLLNTGESQAPLNPNPVTETSPAP